MSAKHTVKPRKNSKRSQTGWERLRLPTTDIFELPTHMEYVSPVKSPLRSEMPDITEAWERALSYGSAFTMFTYNANTATLTSQAMPLNTVLTLSEKSE